MPLSHCCWQSQNCFRSNRSKKAIMPEITLKVKNEVGLHARPASLFVQEANNFSADITVYCGENVADAKSILEVLTLGAHQGTSIKIQAEGQDANNALQALKKLHENNFGEEE